MAFVNEFIPAEDVERFGLNEIDKHFVVGGTNARDWTIDRERDVYLRNVANGGGNEPEIANKTTWTLYWKGDLLTLRLDFIASTGKEGEPGWSHWKLMRINGSSGLPAHLQPEQAKILEAITEALVAYRGGGVYSGDYTSFDVTLDVAEECVL